MRLEEALFNWLQIRLVWNARPKDRSAEETVRFFQQMLQEDHGVKELSIAVEANKYWVSWQKDGDEESRPYGREQAESLLRSIETEPKYNAAWDCGLEDKS
ncbi:hypothetical protein SAMN05444487_101235 [Marininema mesophilum]|uniref:Uncharacterized protein n=1 Tax=Marininema mesophilum TaxID=1048340 RepID=A0A1H2QKV0_9BACL|nr:hypothetical protein [Marininema mesophilum]SDW07039.1 hypothetical protein SAMN05444487_101235 [Marininema mesophilum]